MLKKIFNKSIIVFIFILMIVGRGQTVTADDKDEEKNNLVTNEINDVNFITEDNIIRKTGWIYENNNWYYFNKDGNPQIGWLLDGGKWYYLKDNGEMATGWLYDGGKWYYLQESGAMKTGWLKLDNKWYFLNNSGEMVIGWLYDAGKWYYLEQSGQMKTGWLNDRNRLYFLKANGEMAIGFTHIEGKIYYMRDNGEVATGWIRDNGKWYYAEESGAMKSGWLSYKGKWYYLYENGEMSTSEVENNNEIYYLNDDGLILSGWIKFEDKWYYAETTTSMKSGWLKDNGKWYYLYENGEMATGIIQVNDKKYYLNDKGEMLTGWISNNSTWYYGDSSGQLVKGFITLGVNTYYFNNDSIMVTGSQMINNKEYYFHSDGVMARFEFISGKYYGKEGVFKNLSNGEKITIVLDPGHNYGGDDGAYSKHNGIQYVERELNMQVAIELKKKLETQGYNVILTRNPEDKTYETVKESLKKRVDYANSKDTDLFISIHHDSSSNSSASGFTAFYSSIKGNSTGRDDKVTDISKEIAKNIVNAVSSELGYRNRGAKDNDFYVIKNTTMPSILLECGFISNPGEAQKAANQSNQAKLAESIAKQINKLFRK